MTTISSDLNAKYPTSVKTKSSSAIRIHVNPESFSGQTQILFSGKLYVDLDRCQNNHIITRTSKSILSLSSSKTKNKRKHRHCELVRLEDEKGLQWVYLMIFKIKANQRLIAFFQIEMYENIRIASHSSNKFIVFDCDESLIMFTADSELQRNQWMQAIYERHITELPGPKRSPPKKIEIDLNLDLSDEEDEEENSEEPEPSLSKSSQQHSSYSPNPEPEESLGRLTLESLAITPNRSSLSNSNRTKKNPLPPLDLH